MKELKLENTACPGCDTDDSTTIFRMRDYLYGVPGSFFVSECKHCGLWFQNPRPSIDDIAGIYPSSYAPHAATSSGPSCPVQPQRRSVLRKAFSSIFKGWRQGVGLVPSYVDGGILLEIGCANAERLARLRDAGWKNLYGIELVPEAAGTARSRGFTVDCCRAEDALQKYPPRSFDVIIASMVLEHLVNPFAAVRLIASRLKPGGQFLFSTVNRDSLDARIYGPYWAGFDLPRHMVHLRKKDIKNMLISDFTDIRFFYQGSPVDFLRSSKWRKDDNKRYGIDRIVLASGEKILRYPALVLALMGLTCRVSVSCRKKRDGK